MALRTPEEYRRSLQDGRRVMFDGEWVADVTSHPALKVAVEHAALDFALAEDPRHRDLLTVEAAGERVNRFYRVPQTAADLRKRMESIALLTAEGRTVVTLVHEIGTDALFALLRITSRCDQKEGTLYRPRVDALFQRARKEDWALSVAQTDVKGHRRRGPSEQVDPDLYLRVVDRGEDGIVVRGAKVHTSVSINSNALIVLPTRAMHPGDEAYAVAFWVPLNAPGLKLIASPFLAGERKGREHPASSQHKMVESFTWFDDVFVPWEQVFLCGETEFAGPLALAFVDFHRFTAVSYKLPLLDALLGSAALAAEMNGIAGAGHVREKLARLVMYVGTVKKLLEAAISGGKKDEGGIFVPDVLSVNLAKHHFANGFHEALRDVQDIAGGLLVTAPGSEDYLHPEVGPALRKYLQAAVPAEERMPLLHLIADLTVSELAGYHAVLAVHAEGSLEAEKIATVRAYPLDAAKALALRMAGREEQRERG